MAKKVQLKEAYEKHPFKERYPDFTFDEYLNLLKTNTGPFGITPGYKKDLEEWGKKKNKEQLDENVKVKNDPKKIMESYQETQDVINPIIEADKSRADQAREAYKPTAREDVTTELPGLTPQARRSMQQGANAQINKQVQNYKRMIASSTGRRGIRGGAAAAPQMEVARYGMDAQNQFQRDLMEKDTDLSMRRLAAYLASLEGRSAEDILRRGQYFDYVTGRQQQGTQEAYKKYYDNLFQGVK